MSFPNRERVLARPRHNFPQPIGWLLAGICLVLGSNSAPARAAENATEKRLPNVIVVFADDLGYADLGCFGATKYRTPALDRLAQSGMKFTDFYVAQAVCSASRTGLLTGCYPNRVGILGALGPDVRYGIAAAETTMAEMFRGQGYATAIFGKWHLGHHSQFLPTHHGFDEYFGLPYSNDMWPNHPTNRSFPPLPLIAGETTIETNPDQRKLTSWSNAKAVDFIERNKDRPFFLYVPQSMPHVPLFVSEAGAEKSGAGLYGDVIQEIDRGVGEILETLDRLKLRENTIVIFTSDNGPWLSYGSHAGSAGPLREGKGTTFEGGVRVPCLMSWPGHIPAGAVCREPAMTIDLWPTFAKLTGATLDPQRPIDGRDIAPLMLGQAGARSPHEALFFYWGGALEAVRSGRWKLHFPHDYRTLAGEPGQDGRPGPYRQGRIELSLFDLETDLGETKNVAAEHPEVVARLQALADAMRRDLGDSATGIRGANNRQPDRLPPLPKTGTKSK